MSWIREKLLLLVLMCFFPPCACVQAQVANDPVNPVPSLGIGFFDALETFLRNEDADRFDEQFTSFVVSGGTHGTGAGLSGTPAAMIAYPGGYRVTEDGAAAITYSDDATCWVVAHKNETGNVGTFTRVANTHFLIRCGIATQPTLPVDSVYLMKVVTAGGSVTEVTDLRVRSAVTPKGVVSLADHGVVCDGATDDLAAIQAAADAAFAAGGARLVLPAGDCLVSATIELRDTVCLEGVGEESVLAADSPFPATYTAEGKTFEAPVLFVNGITGHTDTACRYDSFRVDGNDAAPVGLVVSLGANNRFSNLRVEETTFASIIVDGAQNSTFMRILAARSAGDNWKIINGAGNNEFFGCDAIFADGNSVVFDVDTDYPSTSQPLSFSEPTNNQWYGGVFEKEYLTTTRERGLYMVEGIRNLFSGINVASEADEAAVDIEASADFNTFTKLRISVPSGSVRAIRNAGKQNSFVEPFINAGVAVTNLVECSGLGTMLWQPTFMGTAPTGKYIANTSTPNNAIFCQVVLPRLMGRSASRTADSVVDLIDSPVPYFDHDLGEWVWHDWQASPKAWRRADGGSPAEAVGESIEVAANECLPAPTSRYILVDSEGAVGNDDLKWIDTTNIPLGFMVSMASTDSDRDITMHDSEAGPPAGCAQLKLSGSSDKVLDHQEDTILLLYNGANFKQLSFTDGH